MKRYLMLILGCLIAALAFNIFFVPYDIVNGGVSGISLIVSNFFEINEGIFILIASIVLLIICLIFLGKKVFLRCLLGSIIYPTLVYATGIGLKYIPISIDNVLLASVFGGILFGLGLGIIFKFGFATGGTDIIAQLINKYLHLSIGNGILIIDGLIVLIGGVVFGVNTMLYSILAVGIISVLIDRVILGLFTKKSFYIVTNKADLVSDYIIKELGHGVTTFKGKGAFSNTDKTVLLTVIPSSDYYRLKDGLHKIDKDAFFVVSDSYEVSGGA